MASQPNAASPSNDLLAIRHLRESVPFNAYFMRRIRQRAGEIEESFRRDGPEKVDKDKRESLRLILEQYDWIINKMMNEDERSAFAEARQPSGEPRIGQAG